jgi:hypothetical protein
MKGSKEPISLEKKCRCPYCDEEIMLADLPYCQPCQVTLLYCPSCQIAMPRESEVCPQCGGKLEGK